MELAPHLLDAKRARTAVRQRRYYEVDEEAIVRSGGVYVNANGANATARIIRLQRPHVADSSPAAEQFKLAELAFRRFVNRDRMFSVREVDLLCNTQLEEAFRKQEEEFSTRNNRNLRESFANNSTRERRIIDALCDSIWWSTDGCSDGANPLLAWHGTKEENIPLISTQGFRVLSQKDTGWYGKGIYFTQLPNYGEFYINNCLSEHGESFSLVLSWILMGRPFPVVAKMDGAGCMPGYDSHFCLVKGFTPCAENEDPTGDEIVIFQPAQVLPRYIVRYEVKKKAKFTPISLLDSSEEDEDGAAEEDGVQKNGSTPKLPSAKPSTSPVLAKPAAAAAPNAYSSSTSSAAVLTKTTGGEDDESAASLLELTTPEGEEGEEMICAVQAKLYVLQEGQWIDKGVGRLKVNFDPTNKRTRLVLRSATGVVLLNQPVLGGIRVERADSKTIRTILVGPAGASTALLRTATSSDCDLLLNALIRITTAQ